MNVVKLKTEFLPFLSCVWISPATVCVAGHSCVPILYSFDGSSIVYNGKLDESQKREAGGVSAMNHFKYLDRNSRLENTDTVLEYIHQNAISCVSIYAGDKERATKISTSGLDGQIVIWDLNNLTRSMQNLKI